LHFIVLHCGTRGKLILDFTDRNAESSPYQSTRRQLDGNSTATRRQSRARQATSTSGDHRGSPGIPQRGCVQLIHAEWARLQTEFLQLNIAADQRLQQQLAEIANWFECTIVVSGIRSTIGLKLSPR